MEFWNAKRRRVYPRLLVALVVGWSVLGLAFLWARAANEHERYGGDFVVYWSAARIAADGRPAEVFDYHTLLAQERKVVPGTDLYPWHYPPQFLLIVRPLAALPYWAALLLWTVVGLGLLYIATFRIAGVSPGTVGLPLSGVLINTAFGQNGALTGAILGFGLSLTAAKPFTAGLVLGTLSYKPHLAPIALLTLLLTRNWRACSGAAVSAIALAAVSFVVFGSETWRAFLENGSAAADSLFEPGGWQQMPSPLAAVQFAGGSSGLAIAVQGAWSLILLGATVWIVHARVAPRLTNAAIVIATLAASPYVFMYDLAALAVAYAWILRDARERALSSVERIVLGVAMVAWPLCWGFATVTHIQLGPCVLLALFLLVAARVRATAAETVLRRPALATESVRKQYEAAVRANP